MLKLRVEVWSIPAFPRLANSKISTIVSQTKHKFYLIGIHVMGITLRCPKYSKLRIRSTVMEIEYTEAFYCLLEAFEALTSWKSQEIFLWVHFPCKVTINSIQLWSTLLIKFGQKWCSDFVGLKGLGCMFILSKWSNEIQSTN